MCVYFEYFTWFSHVWAASSRVGLSTRARGWPTFTLPTPGAASFSIIGSRNAAVLPVPVWAQPMRSRPSRIGGIAFSCIGVGTV